MTHIKTNQDEALRVNTHDDLSGLILAGGKSQRMGGNDKGLLKLNNKTLCESVIERAKPQVGQLIINTNSDPKQYSSATGGQYPIISDLTQEFLGPLAGVLAALNWLKINQSNAKWLMCFPVDTPCFPTNLVKLLLGSAPSSDPRPRFPSLHGQGHFTFSLWPTNYGDTLKENLESNKRSLKHTLSPPNGIEVEIEDGNLNATTEAEYLPPFFNINNKDDWERYKTFCGKTKKLTK